MISEHPDPELAEYRPVNGWAIAALLVGFAAPLALLHPMLWCVPAVGVAIALVALVRIRTSEIPTIGRKGAMIGLILSLVFLAAAPTRYLTHDYWLGSRADALAQKWFNSVCSGQTQKAFDMMVHATSRHPSPPPAPGAPPEKTAFQLFLAQPPIPMLVGLGEKARPVVVHGPVIEPEEQGRQTVYMWYQIAPPDENSRKPYVVQVQAQRRIEPEGHERWVLLSVWKAK